MDEQRKEQLAIKLMQAFQQMHGNTHMPRPSENMRGAPMILHYISEHDGTVSPSEISKFMGTSTARITAVLGKLEKKGLIVRNMDETDRRKIRIAMTEKGTLHVQKMKQDIWRTFQSMAEYLGEEDTDALVRLLAKMRNWDPGSDICREELEL